MALNRNDADLPEERDPALDRVYALGEREEPPARLDDAIRAAARREVRARPSLPAKTWRWHVPVSLAAVLVLSASLVTLMREEGADQFDASRPAAVPGSPAVVPPAPPAALQHGQPEASQAQNAPLRPPLSAGEFAAAPPAATSDTGRRDRAAAAGPDDRPQRAEIASAPAQRPAPQAQERTAISPPLPQGEIMAKSSDPGAAMRGSSEDAARSVPLEPARPPAPAKPAAPAPEARRALKSAESGGFASAQRAPAWSGFERQPPEKWIDRIEELRRAGDEAEAREMLEEFKRRFPEHPWPAAPAR